jgi:membrane-associated phospholipid phosphatase
MTKEPPAISATSCSPRRPVAMLSSRPFLWSYLVVVGFLGVLIIDPIVYDLLHEHRLLRWPKESSDFHRTFRIFGFLPFIALVWALLGVIDRARSAWAGLWIFVAAAASGLAAELAKAIIGRERPGVHEGMNYFKPFLHGFVDNSNLSFPSSHAAVAFGAAWMFAWFYPRGRWIWLGAAAACAWTRVAAEAHFVSDCYGAAVFAFLVVLALRRWARLPEPDRQLPARSRSTT